MLNEIFKMRHIDIFINQRYAMLAFRIFRKFIIMLIIRNIKIMNIFLASMLKEYIQN